MGKRGGMTVLDKIKKTGGFLDCGAVGSMPLGYFLDGQAARTHEYYEVMKLKEKGSIIDTGNKMNNKVFPIYLTNNTIEGSVLKAK
jgi:hypothetical protein